MLPQLLMENSSHTIFEIQISYQIMKTKLLYRNQLIKTYSYNHF